MPAVPQEPVDNYHPRASAMTPPPPSLTPRQAAAEALAVIDRLAHSGRPTERDAGGLADAAYRRLAAAMDREFGPLGPVPVRREDAQ